VICWYADVTSTAVFGLSEQSPRQEADVQTVEPAFLAYCRMTAAAHPARRTVEFESPPRVRATAGAATTISMRLTNRGPRPVTCRLRAFGVAEQFVAAPPGEDEPLAPGGSRSVELALRFPAWQIAGERSLLVAAVDSSGLRGSAIVRLEIANPGKGLAVILEDGWVARLDAHGRPAEPLAPRENVGFRPGETFEQAIAVHHLGTATETYRFTVSGPAAGWVTLAGGGELDCPAESPRWSRLVVRVPAAAEPGYTWFDLRVTARGQPAVTAQRRIDFDVIPAVRAPRATR